MKNTAMNSSKNVLDNPSGGGGGGGQQRRSHPTPNPGTGGGPRNNVVNDSNTIGKEFVPIRQDEISRSLPVPEYKIGWIIGKRGSYINQLAEKSGASVSISDSSSKEYGTIWKYVQLRGSGRAVDRAKKLLHIRLERLEPRPTMTDGDGDGDGNDINDGDLEGLDDGDFEYGDRKNIGEETTEGDVFESPSYISSNQRVGYHHDNVGRGGGRGGGGGGGGGFHRGGRSQSPGNRGSVGGRSGGYGRGQGAYEGYGGQDVTKSLVEGHNAISLGPQDVESRGNGHENQQKNRIQQQSIISKEES